MFDYIIDTHSHLDAEEFDGDRLDVVRRAKNVGVRKILLPNINAMTIDGILSLCAEYNDFFYPMLGLHPEDVREDFNAVLDNMEKMLMEDNSFIAIGEVGLDFYWEQAYKKEQIVAFERQIDWAKRYCLPLMIHSRSSYKELMETMRKSGAQGLSGVFHCFSGTVEEAEGMLAFPNFKLGIGGILTFKKSSLPAVLKEVVPLNRIVLETDSPYLAPVPHRGKRNESAFISETAKKVAEVYGCGYDEVIGRTTQNAMEVFMKLDGRI